MQWILSAKHYFCLYNINEIIFLSFYHMNTVTKQRDPDTGQHSLLFQVLGLYRHCICLANIVMIVFIQSEQLITLKKSVINLGAVLPNPLKLSILLFSLWSFTTADWDLKFRKGWWGYLCNRCCFSCFPAHKGKHEMSKERQTHKITWHFSLTLLLPLLTWKIKKQCLLCRLMVGWGLSL